MVLFILLVSLFSMSASEHATPVQKVQLSDDVLDQLNELEKIYKQMVNSGLNREDAAIATVKWRDARYPLLILNPLGYKSEEKSKVAKDKDAEK